MTEVELVSGGLAVSLPGDRPDMLRGLSLRHDGPAVLIVDEASRVRDELWATISPMLARLIVSRSCSAAGESGASTMECLGMPKDAQASPSPQGVTLIQDTPAASAFKKWRRAHLLESSPWRTTLCKLRAGGERSCQKTIFLPLQLCVHSAMN
jgi:hypothetical protein